MQDQHEIFLSVYVPAQPVLRRYIMAHVADYHAAEDALQRVALVLWRKFDQYDHSRPFRKWAMGVAYREVLASWRRTGRDRLVLTEDIEERLAERLEAREAEESPYREFLESCVQKLQDIHRQVFDMKYRDGLRCDKIADEIERSPNAVRMLLYRIREALRQCVRETSASAAANGAI